jgi:Tol biopolymer transport system component
MEPAEGETLGYLSFLPSRPENIRNIWISTRNGDQEPRPLVASALPDMGAAISPDGRWLAYVSGEYGRFAIYLQPFPDGVTMIGTALSHYRISMPVKWE